MSRHIIHKNWIDISESLFYPLSHGSEFFHSIKIERAPSIPVVLRARSIYYFRYFWGSTYSDYLDALIAA